MNNRVGILSVFILLSFLGLTYMVYANSFNTYNYTEVNKSLFKVISNDNLVTSEGTGFAIDSNKILTCYHVVKYSTKIVLQDMNGSELTAKLISYDSLTDLAVLEIDESVQPLQISYEEQNSSKVIVAHQNLIEKGTVVDSNLTLANSPVDFLKLIKLSGPNITYGSSGGPILNQDGQVIGIIVAKMDEKNVTYTCAIPFCDVKKVLNQIMSGKPYKHKKLGIKVQELNSLPSSKGLVVTETTANSPAYMNLFPNDEILEINSYSVASISDLSYRMLIDSELLVWDLKVKRNGKVITISINT
ncbi:hypothetical protein DP73_04805 [Desulfosporosinus sp. HMP52]|uniref:S1C family serine protease n=1 Tax=Desulfosporosinus sp. HMP52 TaxID=1487923 RepID=UPI00051FAF34|nr:S1C family serine protease [Desulfosporosinus sp. HMP52]KGK91162.1 hypothetical protein DP73_04805 [Desulfosporosinus sp. HMP52]